MSDFWNGIAPAHRPALFAVLAAAVLAVPVLRVVRAHAGLGVPWASRLRDGWVAAGTAERWAAVLLLTTGVVHLGLPLGHAGGLLSFVAFVGSGAAYTWLAHRAVTGRRWRALAVALLLATLVAYTVALARGEEADQLGLATALVELTALGLALSRRRRALAAVALSLVTLVFGAGAWISMWVGHDDHRAAGDVAGPSGHHHHGGYLARGQAGIIMRPGATGTTEAQRRAATELAAAVRTAVERYRDLPTAVAAGYRQTNGGGDGLDLHYEHNDHQNDAKVLDPTRPEMLVYARAGGRVALLGVVFQVPRAGDRGPQVGGASTPWHAHNICVGPLPPGFGAVTPYGACPFLTVQITIAEMMHVWVVDNPEGPFADNLPEEYARRALAAAGRPS